MSYRTETLRFPSCDGKNSIHAEIYIPEGVEPRGVIQITHGMIDHIGRYKNLVEYFTGEGFAVAGADHLGHGGTAAAAEDFGYFAARDGYSLVVRDAHAMNALLHERYPDLPVVLLGHSMGSFIARLYAVEYPESIDGLIIHGTAGKNPAAPFGILLCRIMALFRGKRYRSRFIASLANGGYDKHFPKEEGKGAWLTRETAQVADREGDPRTSFEFTLSGYIDLFKMLSLCNKRSWYKRFPKELPTLIVSGEADPVGAFGKGVRSVYSGLLAAGVSSLQIKLYEGARHELFNEINRNEVFGDLSEWLLGIGKR